jgi:hypothetical protein
MVELDMDPATLLLAVKTARDIFKGVKESVDLIPDPVEKQKVLTELALLEKQLSVKDVEFAKAFGYELCRGHFPPEIMLDMGDVWKCSACGKTMLTTQGQEKENARELEKMRASNPVTGNRIGTPKGW